MLERIDTKEIMTVWEASKKYRTKYICMVITENVDDGDNDLGYVLYIADSNREIHGGFSKYHRDKELLFMPGHAAEPLQVGGYHIA